MCCKLEDKILERVVAGIFLVQSAVNLFMKAVLILRGFPNYFWCTTLTYLSVRCDFVTPSLHET